MFRDFKVVNEMRNLDNLTKLQISRVLFKSTFSGLIYFYVLEYGFLSSKKITFF